MAIHGSRFLAINKKRGRLCFAASWIKDESLNTDVNLLSTIRQHVCIYQFAEDCRRCLI